MLFFLEGKNIEIIKSEKGQEKKQGLVLVETDEFLFLKTKDGVEKIKKKKLIVKIVEKNKIFYLKTENLPKIKQRIKKIKKFL